MRDSRGHERGRCKRCSCPEFIQAEEAGVEEDLISGDVPGPRGKQNLKIRCAHCECPPAAHERVSSVKQAWEDGKRQHDIYSPLDSSLTPTPTITDTTNASSPLPAMMATHPVYHDQSAIPWCCVPGCNKTVDFDLNTGRNYQYCQEHNTQCPAMTSGPPQCTRNTYAPAVVHPYPDPSYPDHYYPPQTEKAEPALDVEDIEGEDYQLEEQALAPPYIHPVPVAEFPAQQVPSLPHAQPGCMDYQPAMLPDISQTTAPMFVPQTVDMNMPPSGVQKCAIAECPRPCFVDDSGQVHACCGRSHAQEHDERRLSSQQAQVQTLSAPQAPPSVPPSLPQVHPSGAAQKCAIAECPLPCFVDDSGQVHDCCGYTHAMEHQRRLAIQQQTQASIIKGVTHCLLPECQNPTWPFQNYCGKSHATLGQQRGLVPPPPPPPPLPQVGGPNTTKDSSLCLLPGCNQPRYTEGGTTHPYCGKTHAQQGKQLGISPTTDKTDDQCELPGCSCPKRREGTRVHDYCCLDHAQKDAPNREVLTSLSEVKKFLDKFKGTLNVVSMDENPVAKPGGVLFQRYKAKSDSLPKNHRKTCLAFHGTSENNIPNICSNGYDPSLRKGQAHGPGEYFATTPNIPLTYCKGGRKLLLNELLLGVQGTHHTRSGDIVVMKDPHHDLPRFVITFK